MVKSLINLAAQNQWTVERFALVCTYALMVDHNGHRDQLQRIMNNSIRPMMIQQHCATCACENKNVQIND